MRELGKFRLGERVEVIIDVKIDFPAKGHIVGARIRLGKYDYHVKFDSGLFKTPILQQVYKLWVSESKIKRIE